MCNNKEKINTRTCNCTCSKVIEGVGKDAEITVNEKGGKQSVTGFAPELIDPWFLKEWYNEDQVISHITDYMIYNSNSCLLQAIYEANLVNSNDDYDAIIRISQVLKYGADRYEPNNWRLIPAESHLRHALIHYFAYKLGDTQDDHLDHCLCRLMMCYATNESEGFNYTSYQKPLEDDLR